MAVAAGDTAAAKTLNRKAEKLLDHAPSTLMLSAQAAQLEGDEGVAQVKFQRMLGHRETEFLGLRGMLAQAIKDGDTDTALKLARRAYLRRPNTPWVLTTLFDLQTQAGLWTEALSTVGDMARYKLIDSATATRRRAILFHQAAADKRAIGRTYEALELAQKAHRLLPGLAPIAVQTSALADQANKPRVARKIIETSWRAKPHPALAKALLDLAEEPSPGERFKLVERLYQLYPNQLDAELTLAAGAIAAARWQDARAALGARTQAGADGVGLSLAGRAGASPRRRWREGAGVVGQSRRRPARSRLVVRDHRRGTRHLVRLRPGRSIRQPPLGLAPQDRAPVG